MSQTGPFSTQLEQDPDYLELAREHPMKAALCREAFARLDQIQALIEQNPLSQDWPFTFHRLAAEFNGITTWVSLPVPVSPGEREEQGKRLGQTLLEAGVPFEEIQEQVVLFKQGSRGAPPIKRVKAVEALEKLGCCEGEPWVHQGERIISACADSLETASAALRSQSGSAPS